MINAEWAEAQPLDGWEETLTEAGRLLGARLSELGGPPAETRSEQLLRHALALTNAETDAEVLVRACRAAREVTGLAAAVLLRPAPDLLPEDQDLRVVVAASSPEPRDRPLVARLGQIDPDRLAALLDEACRYGASYTLGDPAVLDARGFEALTAAGVRTMIAVPLGAGTPVVSSSVGALVVLDETAIVPDSALVNLLELLAAQASTCLEKLDHAAPPAPAGQLRSADRPAPRRAVRRPPRQRHPRPDRAARHRHRPVQGGQRHARPRRRRPRAGADVQRAAAGAAAR